MNWTGRAVCRGGKWLQWGQRPICVHGKCPVGPGQALRRPGASASPAAASPNAEKGTVSCAYRLRSHRPAMQLGAPFGRKYRLSPCTSLVLPMRFPPGHLGTCPQANQPSQEAIRLNRKAGGPSSSPAVTPHHRTFAHTARGSQGGASTQQKRPGLPRPPP